MKLEELSIQDKRKILMKNDYQHMREDPSDYLADIVADGYRGYNQRSDADILEEWNDVFPGEMDRDQIIAEIRQITFDDLVIE
jgi:hypothetical protein